MTERDFPVRAVIVANVRGRNERDALKRFQEIVARQGFVTTDVAVNGEAEQRQLDVEPTPPPSVDHQPTADEDRAPPPSGK